MASQKASYSIESHTESELTLKATKDGALITVHVVENEGRVELKGLPPQLGTFLFNFTDREIREDTVDIINVLITMYDSKGNGQVNIVN